MLYWIKARVRKIYIRLRGILLRPILLLRGNSIFSGDEIKRILFLRNDRAGDMILSTAAVRSLRKGYPRAKITILASEKNCDILKHNPHVDEVLIYKGISWFVREVRPRRYDLVVDPFVTHELKRAFMTCLAGGKYRIGFEESGREIFFNVRGPATSPSKRMVDLILDLAHLAGGKNGGCEPEVFLTDAEIKWASEALVNKGISTNQLTIGIHPGAHYPSQRWPAERFGEVARRILQRGKEKVILLGSSDENGLLEEVKKGSGVDIPIFSCKNIREFIALLSRCDLLVCNNSGPLHIATALKVPTVSMIGPTVTPLWLPYGKNNVVINKVLSCSPCNKAICKDHQCMASITVDEVLEAVQKRIAGMRLKHQVSSTPRKRDRKSKKSWKGERK